ncbi:ATP-dependent DNA helicase RecG [Pontivivens nitratireducens]|uniref:ATP-dependent DNA helicase RecG n=1 Tax=Pontivivens nitratireducens TaxID=2758038 RepID=UPI00163B1730|nr:ATP-dependent DNA helicase RecG [Pontibrevibacter nitratireducens]
MAGRPEVLFPLFADLTGLPGIGPKTAPLFARIGVESPRDLLMTLPTGGTDRRLKPSILDVPLPATVTVEVEIGRHAPASAKGHPYRVSVRDAKTDFQIVYFHARDDWMERHLPPGERRVVSGRVELFDGVAQMVHPDHVLHRAQAEALLPFEPTYPLTAGLTLKTVVKAQRGALDRVMDLPEWIAPQIVADRGWPGWSAALKSAHAPDSSADLADTTPARQRLAYDELFAHQVTLTLARARARRKPGRASSGDGHLRERALAALPYRPTGAQTRAVQQIVEDLAAPLRMNRLLQGDVGSGKTLVALLAMLAVVEAGGQAALMAPTEILARQHMEALAPLIAPLGLRIVLLTGRDKGTTRQEKLSALANGQIHILLGTHALFQSDVDFADLRLAIIDEQHRFGVRERMTLGAKGRAVDILVMTATPIPRSLSLAQYGDMDLSVLDEKPPGRQPIETALVSAERMDQVVARLRSALDAGRQAYWVCPLVEESEVVEATAAEERHRALRIALGEQNVGLVHGRLPPAEKDAAMADFIAGRTRVLVATTVIEVGVNVPAATIMVIEQAERFGLAQLHQLRGRVGRGSEKSTCLLMYQPPLGEAARARMEIMRETEDGFRIADEDLRLRGAGDVLGTAQSGLPRFRIADLERQTALLALAHKDARLLLDRDPDLTTDRGRAVRTLLYLMEQDRAIRLLSVG